MKLLTLAAIVVSGGANFFNTRGETSQTREEVRKALYQIDTVYRKIDDFESRQKLTIDQAQKIAESNAIQLENQLSLLEKADKELAGLTEITKRLDEERARKNMPPF